MYSEFVVACFEIQSRNMLVVTEEHYKIFFQISRSWWKCLTSTTMVGVSILN